MDLVRTAGIDRQVGVIARLLVISVYADRE